MRAMTQAVTLNIEVAQYDHRYEEEDNSCYHIFLCVALYDLKELVCISSGIESQRFSAIGSIETTIVIDDVSIADCRHNAVAEDVTFQRTPFAFALNDIGCNRPRAVWSNDSKVSFVAFAQETAVINAEKTGGIVAHQVGNTFAGKYAFVGKFKHGDE